MQGLTLRPLLLRLRLEDDGTVDREVRLARVETLRAALAAAATCAGAETAELVRHRYELQLRRAQRMQSGDGTNVNEREFPQVEETSASAADTDGQDADTAVVRAATEAQRRRLVALRADGTIGDTAFQRVEEELDWAELDWEQLVRSGQPS
jgi:monovalent cation/hydrogen antiporter